MSDEVEIDIDAVYSVIWMIKLRGNFRYTANKLVIVGFEEVLRRYGVDYNEFSNMERMILRTELRALAEDYELERLLGIRE